MTSIEDIRRLYHTRQWEMAQAKAERARLRNWVLGVMATTIALVLGLLWASAGHLARL